MGKFFNLVGRRRGRVRTPTEPGRVSGTLPADDSEEMIVSLPADCALIDFTQPAHGEVSAADDGSLIYRPLSGYKGPDSFAYRLRREDGAQLQSSVVVNIDRAEPKAEAAVAGKIVAVDDGSHGTVRLESDGCLTYTPVLGFHGIDSFAVTVRDAAGQESECLVYARVQRGGGVELFSDVLSL